MRLCGWVFLVAVCAAFLPQSASADVDSTYDPALLTNCVASAGQTRAALEACKGAGARPCIEADSSIMGLVLCWDREATAWQQMADRAFETRRHSEPERRASLIAARLAWESWRDAECEYRADEPAGGSGVQVDRVRCIAELTADRAIALLSAP
ncbi:MAG: lysozyme inhibitor LprI family protein [Vitreimonas sp.]